MQRLKRAVKRIAAIGTGVAMLGATMTGALAQPDLADYPAPFIVDGKDSGNIAIVIGSNAKAVDTIGALDIATQLQFDSKVCAPDASSTGSISVSGTEGAVPISKSNDLLELGEDISDVREQLSDVEVTGGGLASGEVQTDKGSTDFNQYLKFEGDSTYSLTSPKVVFTEDDGSDRGYVGDYLYLAESGSTAVENDSFFEYKLEFESGLESDISSGKLEDLEDEELMILGTTYTVVDTVIDTTAKELTLTMLGGAVYDVLYEGETRTFNIDGKDYEVNVLIVEDVSPASVTFEINGEITKQLEDSETTVLSDGLLIGVSDIVLNEAGEAGAGDMVELYLGANKLELQDKEYNDTNFESSTVEVNNEDISEALIRISATNDGTNSAEITAIEYRLTVDSIENDGIWVEPGHGVREYLNEPAGMLGKDWDIRYEGLDDTATSIVKLDPSGDRDYNLIFENQQGLVYNVPYMTNEDNNFEYGDKDDGFVFQEGNYSSSNTNCTNQTPNVGNSDYFIVSDADSGLDNDAITNVLRYISFDSSDKRLSFKEVATNEVKEITYTDNTINGTIGKAILTVGASNYDVYVTNASGNNDAPLIIDLDGDGTWSEEVLVTINGGGLLDLGNASASKGVSAWTGTGEQCTATETEAAVNGGANFTLLTISEDFDENGPVSDTSAPYENVSVQIVARSDGEIGLNASLYSEDSGILTGTASGSGVTNTQLTQDKDSDYRYGMTDYGAKFSMYDPSGNDAAEELVIEYPLAQRGARVFVTFGETSTTKTSAGESCTVADLSLSPLLDEDISSAEDYNLIVVGGPCANTVAADLFGACDAWARGAGEAVISMVDNGENVAMMVAGTDGSDTRRAASVLADYAMYEMSGAEAVVTGTMSAPVVGGSE